MFNDILTRANIKTRTLFERYCNITNEKTAIVMACVEGGQPELVQPILDLEKTDQQILMEETYANLVPRQELYPEPISFSLDDFVDVENRQRTVSLDEDEHQNKNDD